MDIFESLENLSVSEACLNDIINIVEEYINEVSDDWKRRAQGQAYHASAAAFDKEQAEKDGYYNIGGYKYSREAIEKAVKDRIKADKRFDKLNRAIEKHNKAKAEGRIKPAKKEDEDDSNK